MGFVATVNVLAAFLLQVFGLTTYTDATWFTFLATTIFHEIAFVPIIVVWIMSAVGSYD